MTDTWWQISELEFWKLNYDFPNRDMLYDPKSRFYYVRQSDPELIELLLKGVRAQRLSPDYQGLIDVNNFIRTRAKSGSNTPNNHQGQPATIGYRTPHSSASIVPGN